MKILVTGASGFAGGWILKVLADHYGKNNVSGTGRNILRIKELERDGYQMINGDLRDEGFVSSQLPGFTHIVNCAAKSSLWGNYQDFYGHNVKTTHNLLELIPSAVQLIHISTPSIYFNFSHRYKVSENAELPKKFVNHYTTTKYLAEQKILNYKCDGLSKIIFRPRAIIGAGDTVILPRVIRAFESGRLKIIGDGKTISDFTSARNLAHAVHLAIENGPELNNEVFNITDGKSCELWPLMMEVLRKLGYEPEIGTAGYGPAFVIAMLSEYYSRAFSKREPILTRYGIGILKYSLTMSIEKAKKLLNYTPLVSTEQSLDEFISWYQK